MKNNLSNRINFSVNSNNKLNCECFTTIRPVLPKYKKGKIYVINERTSGRIPFKAKIIEMLTFSFFDIPKELVWLDAACDLDVFRVKMAHYYGMDYHKLVYYVIFLKKVHEQDVSEG